MYISVFYSSAYIYLFNIYSCLLSRSWTARQQGLWAADCIAKPRTSGSSSAAISANIGLTGGGIDSVTMPLDVSAALELPTLDIIRLARALLH